MEIEFKKTAMDESSDTYTVVWRGLSIGAWEASTGTVILDRGVGDAMVRADVADAAQRRFRLDFVPQVIFG